MRCYISTSKMSNTKWSDFVKHGYNKFFYNYPVLKFSPSLERLRSLIDATLPTFAKAEVSQSM